MPTFDKKITIYCTDKFKKRFLKFMEREGYRNESQTGELALRRFMQDHDPSTMRGAVNQLFGAAGPGFFEKKYRDKDNNELEY